VTLRTAKVTFGTASCRVTLGKARVTLGTARAGDVIVESRRDIPYGPLNLHKFASLNFAGSYERCFQRSTGTLIYWADWAGTHQLR
jgi:hypothetical protein